MSGNKDKIFVTRPFLPPLEEFIPYLEKIWESRQLTNMGPFHFQFEIALKEYLGIDHISLVVNGTVALMLALKALEIKGEVITTPFSFAATSHVLHWNNISPVFVDIEPEYLNIDTEKIRAHITKKTRAIMPVHVFGNICKTEDISQIAEDHDLRVIYDASHAFGVKMNERTILNNGDLSVVSFHATKAFNTFEGGAIICKTQALKEKIDRLKNYGFINETTIDGFGINGKLNEFQSALGVLQLKYFDEQVSKRRNIAETYKNGLKGIPGISFLPEANQLVNTYSYFPIIVDPLVYGYHRDYLLDQLKKQDIISRKYFFPLISDFPIYRRLPSSARTNLPVSARITQQILSLPIYPDLEHEIILKIIGIIQNSSK